MDILERESLIRGYYHMGMSQGDIARTLATNHGIIISERHLRRVLKSLHLERRKDYTDIGEVASFIQKMLNTSGQQHGYRWMFQRCLNHGIKVRKEDVRVILSCLDPEGCSFRQARRLHRRKYFSKGPNYIWHFDGYDKLKPFGFGISGCIDGFSRKIIWLNVYHTNSDPRVIGSYYFEAIQTLRGCPVFMRGDPGTENVLVKQFQNTLLANRRNGHNYAYLVGKSTANQRIESFWGQLRKQCMEFWICLFRDLQDTGKFTGDFLDKQLLMFCFLGILQVGY